MDPGPKMSTWFIDRTQSTGAYTQWADAYGKFSYQAGLRLQWDRIAYRNAENTATNIVTTGDCSRNSAWPTRSTRKRHQYQSRPLSVQRPAARQQRPESPPGLAVAIQLYRRQRKSRTRLGVRHRPELYAAQQTDDLLRRYVVARQ